MKSKNLTPFLFGSKVTSTRPPQPEMVLIVKAKFTIKPGAPPALPEGHQVLAQGTLRGDVFREGDDDQVGDCLYPSDFADFKPQADVLLRGHCHTPEGKALPECLVRFGVGAWSKVLRVVGHRVWMDGVIGPAMSDPVPFVRMPLDDHHAFGGSGDLVNPVGKGIGTRELPNVELVEEVLRSRSDRPAVARFGAVSPHRAERRAKVGKNYGKSYREKRAPYYADDFDWSYFNAAQADQRLPYLRGDEELLFQNLHPEAPVFRTRLPGLRIRTFALDPGGRFIEVPMVLDTLFADLDEGSLHLVWRGVTAARDEELSDETVLVASEAMTEPPLPLEHYREILVRFQADPLEVEDQLPADLKGEWRALQALGEQRAKGTPPDTRGLDPVSALLKVQLGDVAKPQQNKLRGVLEALSRVPMPDGRLLGSLIAEAVGSGQGTSQGAVAPVPGALPLIADATIRKAFRALVRAVEGARSSAAAQEKPLKGMEDWDKLLQDPKLAAMGLSRVEPRPADSIGPGLDLRGQDLSDQDLSGRDLTGADLTGAILTGANLRGAKLVRAKLLQAVLFDADLRGADLSSADLTLATLQGARAEGAAFRKATLDHASFEGAHLAGADLSESEGQQFVLSRADLTGATARGVRWHMAFLEATTLEKANLTEATVTRSFVSKCKGASAVFERATITGSSFAGSDLRRARFSEARGDGSVWMETDLTDADLSYATLKRAHFTEATAVGARFFGANLREGQFFQANLARADFTRANLFDANLHKALVGGALFVEANLYDAKLYQSSGSGCDFRGANLKKSTLERDG
ncbi:DUF2169 family type VI secretion system accessory protein [Chondromyces apiculatus]|uniref:DUF2169 domain-containing protein n=1 Tax=Chondromyces apiculatus DSM 436 TaxID=1192034 RepID=A0A017T2S7_9BACT|nr:DUF2169 domain-containing protein [Chondromyces apiculatus]EYF03140.1 Hypothetical protein CAP_6116 [Chondromyces apiculatus DSM 436]